MGGRPKEGNERMNEWKNERKQKKILLPLLLVIQYLVLLNTYDFMKNIIQNSSNNNNFIKKRNKVIVAKYIELVVFVFVIEFHFCFKT